MTRTVNRFLLARKPILQRNFPAEGRFNCQRGEEQRHEQGLSPQPTRIPCIFNYYRLLSSPLLISMANPLDDGEPSASKTSPQNSYLWPPSPKLV